MKKELLIIVYYICCAGLTRQQAEQQILQLMDEYHDMFDEPDIKDYYIIKDIWLPVTDGDRTEVKLLYPTPKYTMSSEVEELVKMINNSISTSNNPDLLKQWKKLVRELKLKKIQDSIDE